MSDLSTTHNREKWQRSLENLHNQQLEDKLGTVIEKARISGADKLEANFLPDSISNLRSGIDRSKQESEAKYGIILSAMEKSIPLYNVSIWRLMTGSSKECSQERRTNNGAD